MERKTGTVVRNTVKAMMFIACGLLALRQVMLLVDEYQSFPISSLYKKDDVEGIPAPAFTICPKPSKKVQGSPEKGVDVRSTMADEFGATAVSLSDVVLKIPFVGNGIGSISTVNGETVANLSNGSGHWSERTFFGMVDQDQMGGKYYKCFTLFPKDVWPTGPLPCVALHFTFDFKRINRTTKSQTEWIEVFVHDVTEHFTTLHLFRPEKVVLFNNTITSLIIRPEVIQKQSKKKDPCSWDQDYSYTRCLENCFWERFQSNPAETCVIPSLLPQDVNLTAPECKDLESEQKHDWKLLAAIAGVRSMASRNCNCPKKCKMTDYYLSSDPSSTCQRTYAHDTKDGEAKLFLSFPSTRLPQFVEKERVTLADLLSNIGGIIGICLGFSLITIFDFLDQILSSLRSKLFSRKNDVTDSSDNK